jgi:hypothetical protein
VSSMSVPTVVVAAGVVMTEVGALLHPVSSSPASSALTRTFAAAELSRRGPICAPLVARWATVLLVYVFVCTC